MSYNERYNLIYNMSMTSVSVKDNLRKEFLKNGYDITIDNFAILSRLFEQNNITQNKLCELTCKNKSNLTRILDTMEKKGMVKRNQSPDDRRSFTISLTDYSISLQSKLVEIAKNYSEKIFSKISEEDIQNLKAVFFKLNDEIGDKND